MAERKKGTRSRSRAPAKAKEEPVVLEAPAEKKSQRPNAKEQFERNMKIVADKMRGDTWARISERHALSIAQCKKVFVAFRDQNDLMLEANPVDIVRELLEGYMADIADLTEVYRTCDNPSARVGAINARLNARAKIIELRQAIGNLPHDLGTLRLEVDAQVTVERVFTVLERFGLPDEAWVELVDALGGPPPGYEDTPALTAGSQN